ncbi:unnamed protein product, partial [Sphacelaria rigidula]
MTFTDCACRLHLCLQALLTDMYQLTMAYAYWKTGRHNEEVS